MARDWWAKLPLFVADFVPKLYKVGGIGMFPMAGDGPERPSWMRFSGIGINFAAAVGGFAAVGFWIDSHWQTKPWGVVIGAGLGLLGGSYNLIRETKGAFGSNYRSRKTPPEKR